jgi:hypothetical protein
MRRDASDAVVAVVDALRTEASGRVGSPDIAFGILG